MVESDIALALLPDVKCTLCRGCLLRRLHRWMCFALSNVLTYDPHDDGHQRD
jgi:hypothetical protein